MPVLCVPCSPEEVVPDEEVPEEVEDLLEDKKNRDALRHALIKRVIKGKCFTGYVENIQVDRTTKERLYLIKYCDGEAEHLTALEVRECLDLVAMTGPTEGRAWGVLELAGLRADGGAQLPCGADDDDVTRWLWQLPGHWNARDVGRFRKVVGHDMIDGIECYDEIGDIYVGEAQREGEELA